MTLFHQREDEMLQTKTQKKFTDNVIEYLRLVGRTEMIWLWFEMTLSVAIINSY